jgi:hypothetical protein
MQSNNDMPQPNPSHTGGNIAFWQDEMVKKYDYQQSLLSEKKDELLAI